MSKAYQEGFHRQYETIAMLTSVDAEEGRGHTCPTPQSRFDASCYATGQNHYYKKENEAN